ncbi:hypothetical protein D5086_007079 [Populus alba]|uniref:Uncharacterized protein n=1 Tax=Populus alba TaxID=43335 RepID=A0ACC4CN81_POPAL
MLLLQMDVRMVHTYAVLVTYALLLVSHKYLCIKASFQTSAGDTGSLSELLQGIISIQLSVLYIVYFSCKEPS